jgi:hypothetical protein
MHYRRWVGLAVLVVLVLWLPRSSEARRYGAIAYDEKSGAWGIAHDQGSKNTANQRALDKCRNRGRGCELVVTFWGEQCGAYARGPANAAGWGTGDTRFEAERNAFLACQRQGKGCQPRVWSCNARSSGNEAFSPTPMCHFWDSAAQAYVTRFCSSR